MFLGIVLAIFVAIFWSIGEISYSHLSKNLDRANVYFHQYLKRAVIYILVVVIFDISLFTRFSFDDLLVYLPIIICDLLGSYVVNISVTNGKLSVVSPIMAAYPVVDILFGIVLLNEKIGILELLLSIIITISIIVLAGNQKKSKNTPHPVKGIIFAAIYMLFVACSIYFEKNAYLDNFSIYGLYFYKGLIYALTSAFFMLIIGVGPAKLKITNKDILNGTVITPIGNVLNSFSLKFGSMVIVTPISSMYSILTNFLSRKVLKEKLTIKESICISTILLSTILLIILGLL